MTLVIDKIGRETIPADIASWPRRQSVLWLSRHTSDPRVIASIIGSTYNGVSTTLSLLRRDGHDIPTMTSPRCDNVGIEVRSVVPRAVVGRLKDAAHRRETTPADLARKILLTVLADDMIDAILDD